MLSWRPQPSHVTDPLGVLEQVQRRLASGERLSISPDSERKRLAFQYAEARATGELSRSDSAIASVAELGGLGGPTGHEQRGGEGHREPDALLGAERVGRQVIELRPGRTAIARSS